MRALLVLLSIVFAAGCGEGRSGGSAKPEADLILKPEQEPKVPLDLKVVRHLAYHVILKTYTQLDQKAGELQAAMDLLSVERTNESLKIARRAWLDTRKEWESSEGFLFGPVDSLGIDPRLDSWPISLSSIGDYMRTTPVEAITAEGLAETNTNMQGFHTIEYLLFGPAHFQNYISIESISDSDLAYLKAAAFNLKAQTELLAYSWSTAHNPDNPKSHPYVVLLMNPGVQGNPYSSTNDVLAEYLNGIVGILDELINAKMAEPLGASVGEADDTLVESPFSKSTLKDMKNNVLSVKAIYTGKEASLAAEGPGLQALLDDEELAAQIEDQINLSVKKIEAISVGDTLSFKDAIKMEGSRMLIHEAMAELQILLDLIDGELRSRILSE